MAANIALELHGTAQSDSRQALRDGLISWYSAKMFVTIATLIDQQIGWRNLILPSWIPVIGNRVGRGQIWMTVLN